MTTVATFYFTAFLCYAQIAHLIPFTFANKLISSSFSEDRDGSHDKSENSEYRMLQQSCDVSATVPISSRGFARSCCDVYPAQFGGFYAGYFEAGVPSDPKYFFQKEIKTGDVIYVVSPDFPRFLDIFYKLPESVRITLVTGCEDMGVPWEIFHPDRGDFSSFNMKALWPSGQKMTMREFIGDQRLVKWYTQNYDMLGNTSFTSSDVDIVADKGIVEKVFPIPIGLDFHTLAEKTAVAPVSVCHQRRDIQDILSRAPPFLKRKLSIYAKFDCNFPAHMQRIRSMTRGAICNLLASHEKNASQNNSTLIFSPPKRKLNTRSAKLSFWTDTVQVQFVLAPPGCGTDTHRAWEILVLHTVPIVITSPLDRLYGMFPVIIVKDWSEVFAEGSLQRFQSQIVARFGEDPFSKKVDDMLRADYWRKVVRANK